MYPNLNLMMANSPGSFSFSYSFPFELRFVFASFRFNCVSSVRSDCLLWRSCSRFRFVFVFVLFRFRFVSFTNCSFVKITECVGYLPAGIIYNSAPEELTKAEQQQPEDVKRMLGLTS